MAILACLYYCKCNGLSAAVSCRPPDDTLVHVVGSVWIQFVFRSEVIIFRQKCYVVREFLARGMAELFEPSVAFGSGSFGRVVKPPNNVIL